MKLKMKSAIKLYESFLKEGAEAPAAAETTSATSREAVIKDVDTIITSLETLVSQVSEELEEEFNTPEKIEEAVDDNIIVQWITSMKAVKAQKKVNNIKVNKVALEIARDEAPNTEQKNKIKDRETLLTSQIKSLQDAVNDRFANKGGLVDKKLSNAKIEGELAVIKAHSGAGIDKKEAGDLKQRMADLQKRYKENEAALKELEPSEEDKKTAAKSAQDKKDQEAAAAAKAKKTSNNEPQQEPEQEPQQEPQQEEPRKDDNMEADIAQYDQNIKDEMAREADLKKKLKSVEDEKAKSTDPESFDEKIINIKAEIDKSKQDIKQMKDAKSALVKKTATKESLILRAEELGLNELASEISEKEEWQLNGTPLYSKYDAKIKKVEYSNSLNESRYTINTVKDRFAKLI